MAISGTKEWSVASVNCLTGCSHACRYCYARHQALRFGRIQTPDQWSRPVVRASEVKKRRRKVDGTIMFPTTHDVLPDFLTECTEVIGSILRAGNRILIVSKPHLECIRELCDNSESFREQILFRFTIGAADDSILSYWEPAAPTFDERLECLRLAHDRKFSTSVSIEPMLDTPNIGELIDLVDPYVTDTIWLGKLNQLRARALDASEEAIRRIEAGQIRAQIMTIYHAQWDRPKIRWKESIKKVVGLDRAETAGLDV